MNAGQPSAVSGATILREKITFLSIVSRLLVPLPMRSVALVLATLVPFIGRAASSSDPLKDAPPPYREAVISAMRCR